MMSKSQTHFQKRCIDKFYKEHLVSKTKNVTPHEITFLASRQVSPENRTSSLISNKNLNLSVIFVDDTYLQGDTKQECLQNIEATVSLLESHCFAIHKGRSILNQTQEIEFPGFVFNSVTMTISITKGKTEAIVSKIRRFLENKSPKIGELASAIGSVISLFPAVPFSKLHYRA